MTSAASDLPPFDVGRMRAAPFPARVRMVCQSWAAQVAPNPRLVMALYWAKYLFVYAGGWALFVSFEQVDGSATRRVGGLGLGLSFVRRLAEDAGFPLRVASEVGKGSEFSLDLPISDVPAPKRPRR